MHPPAFANAPSDRCSKAGALNATFDAMLLNPTTVANNNFIDNWGKTNSDVALALSSVDDARLKDCIVAALASVRGVLAMCPGQLEACF